MLGFRIGDRVLRFTVVCRVGIPRGVWDMSKGLKAFHKLCVQSGLFGFRLSCSLITTQVNYLRHDPMQQLFQSV